MTLSHEDAREALLDLEDPIELEGELQAHLADCEACRSFGDALFAIDGGLAELAPIVPPEALLERTREAIDALPREAPTTGGFALFAALLAGILSGLWALVALLFAPFTKKKESGTRGIRWGLALSAVATLLVAGLGSLGLMTSVDSEYGPTSAVPDRFAEMVFVEPDENNRGEVTNGIDPVGDDDFGWIDDGIEATGGDYWGPTSGSTDSPAFDTTIEGEGLTGARQQGYRDDIGGQEAGGEDVLVDGRFEQGRPIEIDNLRTGNHEVTLLPQGNTVEREADRRAQTTVVDETLRRQLAAYGYALDDDGEGREDENNGAAAEATRVPAPETAAPERGQPAFRDSEERDHFVPRIAVRERVEGLSFRSPTGYWANTYVPGDPAIRALRRRLADHPAAAQLASLAQPGAPGFEAPRSGALALDVSADRAEVEGRSRVLLSVGLRGAEGGTGRRPRLRTQVLVDLRQPLDASAQARVRALLTSLARRRDATDRIGLIAAGSDGGALVPLGRMRFGELSVALRRAFEGREAAGTTLSLRNGLERAVESVGQLEGDGAPLGASMVLIVTPSLSDSDARELERAAHVGALAGVATSVIGLDEGASLDALERVALAGHGRRRVLESAADADRLVREEIEATSRVSARAVRLRIRLAEGAHLVDVLGSRPLDATQSQRVRDAERAVDRALAARLGIRSDRGEDEDGIQIVLPAFYAGDTHRVLLDLVVDGPGPVADVQVRFKDLLRLGNGTLTDRLVLPRGSASRGPRQRAVLSAWLGHEVARGLRAAARELDAGRPNGARAALEATRQRVAGARESVPELASDPALSRDVTLVARYAAALDADQQTAPGALATSMRFAAHRRLLGDPLGLSGEPTTHSF